jgi:hypothetical protein
VNRLPIDRELGARVFDAVMAGVATDDARARKRA